MDLISALVAVAAQVIPQIPSFLHQLVPAVPVVAFAAIVYLLAGDALDAALVAKRSNRKARLYDYLTAIANDVAQKQALSMAAMAVATTMLAGGDVHAQIVAALIAVAAANVVNLEASMKQKLVELLS